MPTRKSLFVSIENGGDGSATIRLYDSEELSGIAQEYADEPWAEDCSRTIVLESETPITVVTKVYTLAEEIAETTSLFDYIDGDEERERLTRRLAALEALRTEGS